MASEVSSRGGFTRTITSSPRLSNKLVWMSNVGSFSLAAALAVSRISATLLVQCGEIAAKTFFPDGPGTAGDAVGYRRDLAAYISARDLAQLITKSARGRRESQGSHRRADFPPRPATQSL